MDYNRLSLNNALIKGDFVRASEKVEDELLILQNNINDLKEYSLRIGSKKDNTEKSQKANELIENTGNILTDIYNYIKDIKDFQYITREDKMKNIKKAREYENKCNALKVNFEELTNKIKQQGQQVIDSARNSLKLQDSFNDNENNYNQNEDNKKNDLELKFINGREYLEGIDDKEKQIKTIVKVTNQINEISKKTADIVIKSGEKVNSIEENINSMDTNIKNAVDHMKEAKKSNDSAGGYSNKLLYAIGIIVLAIIFIAMVMPNN